MKFAPEAVGIGPALAWLRLAPRGATSWARPLPDFLVIGAMRSGTSSFYDHLARHPRIAAARVKEVHFFDYRWHLGTAWYRSSFPLKRSLPPGGVHRRGHPLLPLSPRRPGGGGGGAARRAADRAPQGSGRAGFLALAPAAGEGRRDPVVRGRARRLEERLADEHERLGGRPRYRSVPHQAFSYKARGLYADQLERWIERFDRRSILVLRSEELFADPARVVAKALRFLGLPLRAFFKPHDRRLCRLLGWESAW